MKSPAWPGPAGAPSAGWRCRPTPAGTGWTPRFRGRRTAWRTPGSACPGTGTDRRPSSCRAARTNWASSNRRKPRSPSTSQDPRIRPTECRASTIRFSSGGSPAMGAFTMGVLRPLALVMLVGGSALAQGPTYGVGRTPTPEEIRAWDISIGPTGEELPPGRGTAAEGGAGLSGEGVRGMPREAGGRRSSSQARSQVGKGRTGVGCRPLGRRAHTAAPLAVRDDGMGLHQSRHAAQ